MSSLQYSQIPKLFYCQFNAYQIQRLRKGLVRNVLAAIENLTKGLN
jgi:hypothetical protein